MKLFNLVQIQSIFKPDMKFKDIGTGYKVMKFLKSIENDVDFYNNKLREIAHECAEKDGDNIKTTQNGGIVLQKDKVDIWNAKCKELSDVDVDVNVPSFCIDDFSECGFNLLELGILDALIAE